MMENGANEKERAWKVFLSDHKSMITIFRFELSRLWPFIKLFNQTLKGF